MAYSKKKGFAAALIEIHELNKIAQFYGFQSETQLIQTIQERLVQTKIKRKSVFKINDNLFFVVLADIQGKMNAANPLLETLQKALQFSINFQQCHYVPLYNIGAVFCEEINTPSEVVLAMAFAALNEVKSLGYNRYCLKNLKKEFQQMIEIPIP